MSQKELQSEIGNTLANFNIQGKYHSTLLRVLMRLINQHVKEVIGEDVKGSERQCRELGDNRLMKLAERLINQEKTCQRKRAGL